MGSNRYEYQKRYLLKHQHPCLDCGKLVGLYAQRCCSCRGKFRSGKAHHSWKGGRKVTKEGYVYILLRPDDFFYPMATKAGYVLEHRLKVAQSLGRCLLSWETVHHKEGYAKDDNRYPETLELLPNQSKHLALTRMIKYIRKLEREIEILKRDV